MVEVVSKVASVCNYSQKLSVLTVFRVPLK
jgi:hypothetical protein